MSKDTKTIVDTTTEPTTKLYPVEQHIQDCAEALRTASISEEAAIDWEQAFKNLAHQIRLEFEHLGLDQLESWIKKYCKL